jgi:exoribonuclease-2
MNGQGEFQERARKILIEAGFEPDFSSAIEEELQGISCPITFPEGVRDLRHLPWSSIDNSDSRDLDQVEYVERGEGSLIRLMIGIADVASCVEKGGPIDLRAFQNTVSIYTAAKTFPMLPEALSTDGTSLLSGQDRLGMVIDMLVQEDGEVTDSVVYHAWIRNHARFSYEQLGNHLKRTSELSLEDADFAAQLDLQYETAQRLMLLRQRTGALTFSSYEPVPVRRGDELIDLKIIPHNAARDLIESFMIAANVATANFLKRHGWPIIERVVHAPKRWDRIREIAGGYGFELPEEPHPKPLADFLADRRTKDREGFNELSLSIVKLLGAGEYVVEMPDGPQTSHFGLALDDYSHSTAPNRRFADLVLQRLLLALLRKSSSPYTNGELTEIATHCTEREHAARKVERRMRKVAAAFLVRNRIGEVFDAIVTGATWKGVFVRVKHPAIEGKVVRGEIGMDVGQRVRVRLLSVDIDRCFIDFARAD